MKNKLVSMCVYVCILLTGSTAHAKDLVVKHIHLGMTRVQVMNNLKRYNFTMSQPCNKNDSMCFLPEQFSIGGKTGWMMSFNSTNKLSSLFTSVVDSADYTKHKAAYTQQWGMAEDEITPDKNGLSGGILWVIGDTYDTAVRVQITTGSKNSDGSINVGWITYKLLSDWDKEKSIQYDFQ